MAAYLEKNQAGIADVRNRIVQIGEGKRVPGCIGEDKFTCVATLSQKLSTTDDDLSWDHAVFAAVRYDVNGSPVNADRINIVGYIPGRRDYGTQNISFTVRVLPDGKVWSIEARLPHSWGIARTPDEYDATGLYEIVAALGAKDCPNLGKMDVDRWIENTVKPSMHPKPDQHAGQVKLRRQTANQTKRLDDRTFESAKLVLCGRSFQFTNAANIGRGGNMRQVYVVPLVTIE